MNDKITEYLTAVEYVTDSARRTTGAMQHLSRLKDQTWTPEEIKAVAENPKVAECDRALKKMHNTLHVL